MISIRLWHTALLDVLPREQLISQWRECSALASNIINKGSPNHILCNFIMNYDYDHFISYSYYVRTEVKKRGYRTMDSVWNKIAALKPSWKLIPLRQVYDEKMNDEYMQICYWNLREKYRCGGFKVEDFQNISIRWLEYVKQAQYNSNCL